MTDVKKNSLAEINRSRTTEKVVKSLNYLKKKDLPISIKSVSEHAGISRKTIYNRIDLKLMIEEIQSLKNDKNRSNSLKESKKQTIQTERLEKLRNKNRELVEQKQLLLEQNKKLTLENTKLMKRVHDLETMVQTNRNFKVIDIEN